MVFYGYTDYSRYLQHNRYSIKLVFISVTLIEKNIMILTKYKNKIKSRFLSFYFLYSRIVAFLNNISVSDRKYVEIKFFNNFGVKPMLDQPKRYNEHVSKILLEKNNPLAVLCVDKYEVREYVKGKISEEILNEIFGVYEKVRDIQKDFNLFPQQFVLKATHGCGWNFICKNKEDVDFKILKITLYHWLRSNFYYCQRELIYKTIKPRIICEKYLENDHGGLIDYKVHCFKGEPKFINVIVGRFQDMRLNTYDIDWNFVDLNFSNSYPNDNKAKINKPELFDKLIEYSKLLSSDFDYVRVDFYIVESKIYFGELTFTPGNGSYTFSEEEDLLMGKFFSS